MHRGKVAAELIARRSGSVELRGVAMRVAASALTRDASNRRRVDLVLGEESEERPDFRRIAAQIHTLHDAHGEEHGR